MSETTELSTRYGQAQLSPVSQGGRELSTDFWKPKGTYGEDGVTLFTRTHSDRTRGEGHKLLQGKHYLDARKKILILRTITRWRRLPREVMESLLLEISKSRLDTGYPLVKTLLSTAVWTL